MKNAIVTRSRIVNAGAVLAVALTLLGFVGRSRVRAQGGLSGTWSGSVVFTTCDNGSPASCSARRPMDITLLLSDTPYGFTAPTPDGGTLDGFVVNQAGDPVFTLRATTGEAGPCSTALATGSGFLNVAQNTLTATLSGLDAQCRIEIDSVTVQKQP